MLDRYRPSVYGEKPLALGLHRGVDSAGIGSGTMRPLLFPARTLPMPHRR